MNWFKTSLTVHSPHCTFDKNLVIFEFYLRRWSGFLQWNNLTVLTVNLFIKSSFLIHLEHLESQCEMWSFDKLLYFWVFVWLCKFKNLLGIRDKIPTLYWPLISPLHCTTMASSCWSMGWKCFWSSSLIFLY